MSASSADDYDSLVVHHLIAKFCEICPRTAVSSLYRHEHHSLFYLYRLTVQLERRLVNGSYRHDTIQLH
jgi:hypothetical protein